MIPPETFSHRCRLDARIGRGDLHPNLDDDYVDGDSCPELQQQPRGRKLSVIILTIAVLLVSRPHCRIIGITATFQYYRSYYDLGEEWSSRIDQISRVRVAGPALISVSMII